MEREEELKPTRTPRGLDWLLYGTIIAAAAVGAWLWTVLQS